MDRKAIVELLDRFISREDLSIKSTNEIEVAIDDEFPEDEYMQDTVEVLACYQPGGGEFLYDEEAVIKRLVKVKKRL